MDDGLAAAVRRLQEAFAGYPRRAVLEGCPHCRGSVAVDEHDLFSLTISLGNTVGTGDDVKSLLPLLLERLATGHELVPSMVLSLLVRQGWRTWPTAEREAVDGYLTAIWRSLLAEYPPRVGSLCDAAEFLSVAGEFTGSTSLFLRDWDTTRGPAADRHLADLVTGWAGGARLPAAVLTWLHSDVVRARLYDAFERDHDASWADDLARAYDLLSADLI
ncbi:MULTISPECIES: hypothetical protein [unclassified Nonomuraea]|uniref:hypothetical protein n=1 Tax=unclassified Nonomuraea TaxID=2593643 RepID=UPI0033DB4BBF